MPRFHRERGRQSRACLNKQLQIKEIKKLENANAEVWGNAEIFRRGI
jgi:hypothetical protein